MCCCKLSIYSYKKKATKCRLSSSSSFISSPLCVCCVVSYFLFFPVWFLPASPRISCLLRFVPSKIIQASLVYMERISNCACLISNITNTTNRNISPCPLSLSLCLTCVFKCRVLFKKRREDIFSVACHFISFMFLSVCSFYIQQIQMPIIIYEQNS